MLESKVENYFQQQIRLCGGVTLKFTSPSMRGVPDQIALHNGSTHFVELKAPGGKPRESQIAVHEMFEEQKIPVYTLDSIESVDLFVKDVLKTKPKKVDNISFEIKDNMFQLE